MSSPPPAAPREHVSLALAEPGGVRRLLGGRRGAASTLALTPAELVVEHATALRGPLRFAPGAVAVAALDPGPADPSRGRGGRFPILHRLAPDRVLPREHGIEGWLWTAGGGSAAMLVGADAPNLALLFSAPLGRERIEGALAPDRLAELAKRSPLGQPALTGLLLRVVDAEAAKQPLQRYGMLKDVTDRDVPPAQRRHLPDDQPANPDLVPATTDSPDRARGSVPPPGAA